MRKFCLFIRNCFFFSFFLLFFFALPWKEKYNIFFQILQVLSWNLRSFLSMKLESCISWIIRSFSRVDSFYFFSSELFFVRLYIVDFWQCSEHVSDSKSTRFLNMLLVLNMWGFWIYLSQNIRKFLFLKYKDFSVVFFPRIFGAFWES